MTAIPIPSVAEPFIRLLAQTQTGAITEILNGEAVGTEISN